MRLLGRHGRVGPARCASRGVGRWGRRPPGAFSIDARIDNRNVPYYWVKMAYPKGESAPDSDLAAIAANAISVTPVQMDLTHYAWQSHLHGLLKI